MGPQDHELGRDLSFGIRWASILILTKQLSYVTLPSLGLFSCA